jgi:DNA-binding protein HU-beta
MLRDNLGRRVRGQKLEMDMTKADLIEKLYGKFEGHATKKMLSEVVDGVFGNLALTIKKDKRFSYPGFGTWVVRQRKARTGRNPQTGEVIKIKASKTVGFRAAKSLKETL